MTIKAINVRNQFKGSIKEIVLGDVLSEIDVQTASGIVTSVITTCLLYTSPSPRD